MRVLATSLTAAGHVAAVRPLVRAAVAGGADVRVVVEEAGASGWAGVAGSVLPLPPMDADLGALSDRAWGEAGMRGAQGDIEGSNEVAVREGFGAVGARRFLPTVREQVAEFSPDLLLTDPFEPAALIAAAEARIPIVLASWSLSARLPAYMATLLDGAAGSVDADASSVLAHAERSARFSPLPAGFDEPAVGSWSEPIRWNPSPDMGRRSDTTAGRPFVYATVGTVVGSIPPLANHFLGCLGPAVRAVGADCLVTVGRDAARDALDVPPVVRVESFATHTEVMPRADAVVSHGGINTVLDAAACGVPQVVLPMQAADQHDTARRLTAHGAGIGLPTREQSAEALETALRSVLGQPDHARRAERLAEEMVAMPSAEEAWQQL